MPHADVNGAQLWFEEEGAGPAVVFVHGGLGDLRLWEPQAKLLAQRFRCVRYDLRFWGNSDGPGEEFSPVALDLAARSYAASFVQGVTVGALVQGLPVTDGRYSGGPFSWFDTLPLLCGVGLCLGYCLLGAGWLSYRTSQDVHDLAYRWLPRLLAAVGVFLVLAFVLSLALELRVMHRWIERPVLIVFPLAGALACGVMVRSIRNRRDLVPFLCTIALFVTAFLTLAMSFLPYMVPFSVTIEQAAAPHSSLAFLFWGAGIFVLPLTLIYTLIVYFVFKGKIDPTAKYH